ncbi:MAG: sodium:proton antiporter [Zetaproteobacteria bacterium CG12_big_fil_rev_8_21_14_0_65_54_13]|nr:MAG: sodium:proton antiporter [Zetaproteobacteria bacterium CG23_combo_of_CG06-09_8_20_14_all_54_7]PIW48260.1 MAG: sodium:proton antiporter [Zetaproteobacteria bacterium CG12_big_fil_rev_8_21_14_0_65_54_13]PIX54560.1 MAG: sodium:proton antiporter [Zetaproteobacteria bacterium CG_4_10_14_3_um_filter_54_28]PJA29722.1 MAG: sodium:proton antiporter [Zetaproteobacteria bacterium CG_4_9_14_3_um_filter_54_145]
MEAGTVFLSLVLILLTARVLGEAAAWLKVPPVMGEMLAGIILGPSLLGWVELNEVIQTLAEIGLILLLFEVGLDTDLSRLVKTGRKASAVALGGFVAPLVTGFALSYWLFDLSLLLSLFIGGTLTATSIGVTVRVLRDLKRHKSQEAQVVIAAAVFDDILGVVLLALLYEFSLYGGISLINAGKVLIFIAVFMLLAPIVAKVMADTIGRYNRRSKIAGLIPTTIVTLVMFFAWLAHMVGAPALLGGFAAGLALSRRFFLPFAAALVQSDGAFVRRIGASMRPIIQLFTPIFFVVVGLSLNLQAVDWTSPAVFWMSICFILLAMGSKLAGAFLIEETTHFRWAVGLSMMPRAEVGLIFAELGRLSGVFDNDIYAVMIITIAATTILPPFMLKWFYGRFGHHLTEKEL